MTKDTRARQSIGLTLLQQRLEFISAGGNCFLSAANLTSSLRRSYLVSSARGGNSFENPRVSRALYLERDKSSRAINNRYIRELYGPFDGYFKVESRRGIGISQRGWMRFGNFRGGFAANLRGGLSGVGKNYKSLSYVYIDYFKNIFFIL